MPPDQPRRPALLPPLLALMAALLVLMAPLPHPALAQTTGEQTAGEQTAGAEAAEVLLSIGGLTGAGGPRLDLDRAALEAMPQTAFRTSTTWTAGVHEFRGVALADFIAALGAGGSQITLRAANDYAITLPMADVTPGAPLLALTIDGAPMSLRDKGPVWLVYPYDADARWRTEETYARSIWQLTQIDFAP